VARLDGVSTHEIVEDGLRILTNLEHRGAVGGDRGTGDGAGVMLAVPDRFFRERRREDAPELPEPGDYAVGAVFLPPEPARAESCRRELERAAAREGCPVLGWRKVPVNPGCLGGLARSTMPDIRQVFLARGEVPQPDFERKLYVIRRQAERAAAGEGLYFASLSGRTLVYKGMFTAPQIRDFYPDLADPAMGSSFAVVHQRYSTNTLPTWSLAQPFRILAHNGEINTLRGNINRMRARYKTLRSRAFGDDLQKVLPAIDEGGSDSAVFDNVLELLLRGGRSLPHCMMMMIPEAWGRRFHMSADKRAFYEYHSAIMEPWDGPAAMVFCDGRYLGATLDRNGLRPARYTITRSGSIVLASETGVLEIPGEDILKRGRLQPGRMFLVDLAEGRIVPDNEIKARISRRKPYRRWVKDNRIELRGMLAPAALPPEDPEAILRMQRVFGYTREELKMVIRPMADRGQEAVGSMGNDAALAVFSHRPQLLFSYFKQLFAQVTNPPIDPLREELVMSLMSWVGRERNLLEETPEHCRRLKLPHPILTPEDLERLRRSDLPEVQSAEIDITYPPEGHGGGLETALKYICNLAADRIAAGATVIVLTDRRVDRTAAPIPSLLAVSALHHYLIRKGLRASAGIVVETGEAREVMHMALLIGYGANAVCPWLAFSTIGKLAEEGFLREGLRPEIALDNYIIALKKGLLKTFSRMGISTIRSYFGAQIFEAVGLAPDVVETYFTGTVSRIGGLGLNEIAAETAARHRRGFAGEPSALLEAGGDYHSRVGGEKHLWTAEAVEALQTAVRNDDYRAFRRYTELIDDQAREHATLRSLFAFRPAEPVPLDEVEPEAEIVRRFVGAAMSFGSLSREAHETIAVAMNRLGARSNSGEGGEDPAREEILPDGGNRRSRIRQIASGRFGVTAAYIAGADELQIKMAQGAKPGEGGQLPGHKVSPEIARVRHTTPGVTLISPPPHHDIYSIEDLAQLIFDLKAANPRAAVSVKLVSETGVGTIAAGVAKAGADTVIVSGYDGGTGASPLTSIKHAGLPWELGLAETQQALIRNRLRERIRVQTDGQLKTGRDVAVAACLGAEEFGFGTTLLVSMGCAMVRKCHLNTCPMGIATQDERLRKKFAGKPEHVERFLLFIARQLREIMARQGFRSLEEMIGRVECLEFKPAGDHYKTRGVDLTALLEPPPENGGGRRRRVPQEPVGPVLDDEFPELPQRPDAGSRLEASFPIRNIHRAVGARLSGKILRRFPEGLTEGTVSLGFRGSAGQSFGAFLVGGVSMRLEGDANDYLGKGMSGGRIVVVPPAEAALVGHENVIVGNTVLYGATGGEVYILGLAGERFGVRNSGATAVVEGIGDHGCEYMTGGRVVVLGPTGNNFAAGMSGGIAYVYDENELFDTRCNLDMVDLESVWLPEDAGELRSLIENHYLATGSARAGWILDNWEARLPLFVKVMPIDYRVALERMKLEEDIDRETVAATEEVYDG